MLFRSGYFGTKKTVITDPISNTKVFYKEDGKRNYSWDIQTQLLLKLLKSRMPEMNIVGFFIAGEGRKGKIGQRTIQDKFRSEERRVGKACRYRWSPYQ